jgi:hypothetical protein
MVIKKSSIASFSIIIVALISSAALAAVEGASPDASFAGWPLPLLIGLVLIFRKQIFSEVARDIEAAEGEQQEVGVEKQQETIESVEVEVEVVEEEEKTAPVEVVEAEKEVVSTQGIESKPEPEPEPTVVKADSDSNKQEKINTSDIIDLSGDTQCQGSTAKGTRCKRKTTLKTVEQVINEKVYRLTICAQHNNDRLKVFFGLIK